LAGLARTLFAEIVKDVRCIEPPLPDDLEMIDNILKLNLKANQVRYFFHVCTYVGTFVCNQLIFISLALPFAAFDAH